MNDQLTFDYAPEADILTIWKRLAYDGQESEEIAPLVVVRRNPSTRDIEQIEIIAFRERLTGHQHLEFPISANLEFLAQQFAEPLAAE